jgi:hypothetical protein
MANRFTVYDVMESKGAFKKNSANLSSQDDAGQSMYNGPVQYPRMLYHPEGKERIIQEGEMITTPMGPKVIMQQRELIWKIVENATEEDKFRSEGWHLHPAEAIRASGKTAPETGADQVIQDLRRKIAELEAQKTSLEKGSPNEEKGVKEVKPSLANLKI